MKLTCKQCGKEFELSESEINFYKSRNLHIPKRCEKCRQANKKNKAESAKPYENTQSNSGGRNGGRNNKFLYAILIIAILLLTSEIVLFQADLFDGYSKATEPIYSESVYTSEDIHNQPVSEPNTATNLSNDESDSSNSKSDTDTANNNSDTEKSKADTSQSTESAENANGSNADTAQPAKPANDVSATGTEPPAQPSSVTEPQYKFRNSELLNEHFEKHGKEMGFATAEDYQAAASAVVTSPDALHKLEAEDGDDVYYIESSNDFVIVSTDGYIRTYFRPNSGIEYYNRQ